MRKILKDYARQILVDHGCNEYSYGETSGEEILRDLKKAYPEGMEYPYYDVVNAIIAISKRKPLPKPDTWHVIYDTDDNIDGFASRSLAQAKQDVMDLLLEWMYEERSLWDDDEPTPERIENWNCTIDVCRAYVAKYNPMTDDYDEYWHPSDADLKRIGWVYWEERAV